MARYAIWGILGFLSTSAFWMALGFGWGAGPRIGSAHLPLLLSAGLSVIALWGLCDTWRKGISGAAIQWRPLLMISAAVALFIFFVDQLGLIPMAILCTVLAYLGQTETEYRQFFAFSLGFALLAWLVFIKGLGLPLKAIGG